MALLKIHLLSDVHLEFAAFVPPINSADVVVLAGDIGVGTQGVEWAKSVFDVPVIYVAGNHEYQDPRFSMREHKACMLDACKDSHVHLLDNQALVINGVRFIGSTLWTDLIHAPSALYCDVDGIIVDYEINRDIGGLIHFTTEYAQALFERNRAWLKSELAKPFAGQTVVVTHHAPSFQSMHAQYTGNVWNPCFMSNLEALMGDGLNLWVHGHTHNNFDYEVKGTRVVCNPRGYPCPLGGWENVQFDPALIIDIGNACNGRRASES